MSERDIVERVRKEVGGAQVLRFCYPKTALEACDEILRLRAELAARAVPDEEVVEILARAAFDQEYWNETDSERDRIWRKNDHPGNRWRERSRVGAKALRAAGYTVIRTEARDGGE